MCGVATLALFLGHTVSGSDHAPNRNSATLAKLGAQVFTTHAAANVATADLVIRSSGISVGHIEMVAATARGARVLRRSEGLSLLLAQTGAKVISVAGTCGKSTTTALLGCILAEADLDPLVIVGSYVPAFGGHVRLGRGAYAVVEACEYDRSFLDLKNYACLVTNIAAEHLDYYTGGLPEIVDAFITFVSSVDPAGVLVACAEDRVVAERLLPRYHGPLRTYGISGGDWQIREYSRSSGGTQAFDVAVFGSSRGSYSLQRCPGSITSRTPSVPLQWLTLLALRVVQSSVEYAITGELCVASRSAISHPG